MQLHKVSGHFQLFMPFDGATTNIWDRSDPRMLRGFVCFLQTPPAHRHQPYQGFPFLTALLTPSFIFISICVMILCNHLTGASRLLDLLRIKLDNIRRDLTYSKLDFWIIILNYYLIKS